MDIEKSNKNFKDKKPKCFNYNKYRHIAKKCRAKKKDKNEHALNMTRKDTSPKIAKESKQ